MFRLYQVRPKGGQPPAYYRSLCLWTAKRRAKAMMRAEGWPGFVLRRMS